MQNPITIEPVGYVSSPVVIRTDENWGNVISRVILRDEYAKGLNGLEEFSHVIIITYLHESHYDRDKHLCRHPRGIAHMPKVGIFSQRAKNRPNPIGITAVSIITTGNNYLEVCGLDAINGTPVIDVKPYYPQYDKVDYASVPEWVNELMKNYF